MNTRLLKMTDRTSRSAALAALAFACASPVFAFEEVPASAGPASIIVEPDDAGLAFDVGDSDDADCVVDDLEIMSSVAADTSLQKPGSRAAGADDGTTLVATLTATGGNFGDGTTSNLTAGKVHIHVLYVLTGDLAA